MENNYASTEEETLVESNEITTEEEPAEEDETVEIDCSQCPCNPDTCDQDCMTHLGLEYFEKLIPDLYEEGLEGQEEKEKEEEKEEETLEYEEEEAPTLMESLKEKIFLTNETTNDKLNKMTEENKKFLRRDMVAYSIINMGSFIFGILFFYIAVHFFSQNKFLISISILIMFAFLITNNFWKGKYWNYFKKSLKRGKHQKTEEQLFSEIDKMRRKLISPPVKKRYIFIYILIVIFAAVYSFT